MKLNIISTTLINMLVKKTGKVIFMGKDNRLHSITQKEEIMIGIHNANRFPLETTPNNAIGTSRYTWPAMVKAVQPNRFSCCLSQYSNNVRNNALILLLTCAIGFRAAL